MATVYDAPPNDVIAGLSQELKKVKEIKPPSWARFAKTGAGREKAPVQEDWWHIRSASLLRKLYIHGPLGIPKLRRWYGGRKNRGFAPDAVRGGSGAVIKNVLVQLESAGLVEKTGEGRKLTSQGKSLVDGVSSKIARKAPQLERYR